MKFNLSAFLQWPPLVSLCLRLGWQRARTLVLFLSRLYFTLNAGERQKIRDAVREALDGLEPEGGLREIIGKVFDGIGAHYYEKLFMAYEDPENATPFLLKNIACEDLGLLMRSLEKGKGVLLVTGHCGAIEYLPTLLAVHGLPVSMIAKFKTEHLKRKTFSQAERYGIRMIDGAQEGNVILSAMQELRNNRILVTQCDEIEEWRTSRRQMISFLGRRTGLDRTINISQKRTAAECVFGVVHRDGPNQYRLMMQSHGRMLKALDDPSISSVGEALLKFLERYIYACPEQWYQWKKLLEIKELPSYKGLECKPPAPVAIEPLTAETTWSEAA